MVCSLTLCVGLLFAAAQGQGRRTPAATAASGAQLVDPNALNLPQGYRYIPGKGLCVERPVEQLRKPRPERTALLSKPLTAPRVSPPSQPSSLKGSIEGVVKLSSGDDVSHAVVALHGVPGGRPAPIKDKRVIQRDLAFVPEVNIVTVGSTVEFPNEDHVYHNIFSVSEPAKFDLGLYKAGESRAVTFTKAGVVDVYCNIHPQMVAKIKVLDTRFYVETGKDGVFRFQNIPEGKYRLTAWHARGEETRQDVEVKAGQVTRVESEIGAVGSKSHHLRKDGTPYGRYK